MTNASDRLFDWSSWALAALLAMPAAMGVVNPREPTHWMALALLWALTHAALRPQAFRRRFVPDASPLALAGIRVWACLVLLVYVLVSDLPSTARLPRELLAVSGDGLSFLGAIPGLPRLLENEAALGGFQALTALALAAGAAGLFTRVTTPLAAVCSLIYVGIFCGYTYFFHQCLIGLYVLAAVSLTPCGDAFSLDAWLRGRRGKPPLERPAEVYAWGRYLCWTVLALPYFFAGLSKLRNGGWSWWEPLNLRGKVYRDSLQKGVFEPALGLDFFAAPDAFFGAIGALTLVMEVGFFLVLFSRRARRILPLGAAAMHLGILVLQNFIFVDALLMQTILFDWKRLGGWVRRRIPDWTAPSGGPAGAGYGLLVAEAAFVLCLGWLARLESFPITAWAMYSNKRLDTTVVYHAAWAEHSRLGRIPAPYERCFRAPNFNPYVRMSTYWFADPQRQEAARKFFEACAEELNRGRPPGERITAFRFEQWRWDWAQDPAGPPYGAMIDVREARTE
jgi:hypothetical protein